MILDIDAKISDLAIKIGPIKNEKEKHEISEEQISNIVKEMIQGVHFSFTLKKEKILSEIIRITKSNQTTATKIFNEME